MSLLLALVACGGAQAPADTATRSAVARQAAPPPAAAYGGLIQNIYIAYFGRPADAGGLAYWADVYRNAGAPTNVVDLYAAYGANPAIQGLLDIFGTSQESMELYPGDNNTFITAIYQNVLSREPDLAGKAYWVDLLDRRAVTRPGAALAIMAGARGDDLQIIARKVAIASSFTALLNTDERSKGYDGNAANVVARDMLRRVGADTDLVTFQASIEATIQVLAAAPAKGARVFTGTVATGRPIANAAITIEDLEGAYAEASTNAMGGYIVDMNKFVRLGKFVSNLKPPFFLHAKYKEGTQDKELHSVAAEPATGPVNMNATPATDVLARSYAWPVVLDSRNPQAQAGAAPLGVPDDADKLQRIKNNIKAMYGDLAAGVGDMVRDRFVPDPNSSPMDAALERTRTVLKEGVVVISDTAGNAMARATVARLNSSALPATDAESVSTAEARQAVLSRGAFSSAIPPSQSGAAVVDNVSPSTANVNEVTTFTVTGKGLSNATVFNLAGCENIIELAGGTSLSRRYSCTPAAAVPQEGVIKAGPGGATLYIFHVSVKRLQPPTVVSFGPSYADQGVETVFQIRGLDFTNGMRFVMNGCSPAREVDSGAINGVSATMREFACTPTIAGMQTAEIFDQSGTKSVASFAVVVSAKVKPVITSYSPTSATAYSIVTLVFRGTDLPAGMQVVLDGCIGMTEDGGSTVERRFSCVPTDTGLVSGTVRDKFGGTLLKTFSVTVADLQTSKLPVVTSFSPGTAVLNQSTVFTFIGTDLTGSMGFTLAGCGNVRELPGGGSTQRQYSCTPTSAGVKAGQINGQSFSVTVTSNSSTDPGTGTPPDTGSSNLPCFSTLLGVWINSILGGTWTFTAPNHVKLVLDSLNYGPAAQQISEMDITSCSSTSMSYKITRAALVNTVDPSYAYDKSARTAPAAYDWNKVYTQAYTVSGSNFTTGGNTYTRNGGGGSGGATGKVAFWSRRTTGTITINVDGVTLGTINSYYTSPPDCNGSGTVTRELSVGSHTFKGTTQDGTYGPTTFTITAGACLLYELK